MVNEHPFYPPHLSDRKQVQYSYLVRSVAIMLVMVDHCMSWFYNEHMAWQTYVYALGFDSLLFFMVSGIHNLPVRNIRSFFCRRVVKIGLPVLLWTLLYVILDRYVYGMPPTRMFYRFCLDIFFAPPFEWLWFVYVLVGLYIISPFISQVINTGNRKLIELYLAIWLFTGFLPYVETFFGLKIPLENMFQPFVGYLGYMVMGWFLHRYPFVKWSMRRKVVFTAVIGSGLIIPLILVHTSFGEKYGVDYFNNNLSLCIMSLTVTTFLIFQRIGSLGEAVDRVVRWISSISYPMYLCHWLVGYYVVKPYFDSGSLGVVPATLLTIAVTMLISVFLRNLLYKMYRWSIDRYNL